jgi:hypothetical protein
MTADLTRAAAAPRTTELDQLTIEEDAARACLVDDVLDRIAASGHPAELDGIVRDMWVDHTNGLLAEAQMEVLDEVARARRAAFKDPCPPKAQGPQGSGIGRSAGAALRPQCHREDQGRSKPPRGRAGKRASMAA